MARVAMAIRASVPARARGINGPGGTETAGGPKEEKAPTGRIQVAEKQTFDDSSLTPDIVLAKIQSAYMAGIKRCYKEHLKKDASARGKVTLDLTVNETGRTTSGKANGFASEIDDCISRSDVELALPDPEGQGRRADRSELPHRAPARSGLIAAGEGRCCLADRPLGRGQIDARDGSRQAARRLARASKFSTVTRSGSTSRRASASRARTATRTFIASRTSRACSRSTACSCSPR